MHGADMDNWITELFQTHTFSKPLSKVCNFFFLFVKKVLIRTFLLYYCLLYSSNLI